MKIVVASQNPVKIGASEDAFGQRFPNADLQIVPTSVPSGVSDQPMSDQETWQGAHNRCVAARLALPDADFYIGLEGGVDTLHGQLCTFAWIVIHRADGEVSQSRTSSLPLPEAITALIHSGLELGHACDQVFKTQNAKQKLGAIGLLTNGLHTRRSIYAQTCCFALAGLPSA